MSARIAYGGMASIPKRAKACEATLMGKIWNKKTIKLAQEAIENDFSPISDVRASKEYRRFVAQNLLERFYSETQSTSLTINLADRSAIQRI